MYIGLKTSLVVKLVKQVEEHVIMRKEGIIMMCKCVWDYTMHVHNILGTDEASLEGYLFKC